MTRSGIGNAWGNLDGRAPTFDPVDYRGPQRCGVRHQAPQRHRSVATRFDELAVCYQVTLNIAAINEWL